MAASTPGCSGARGAVIAKFCTASLGVACFGDFGDLVDFLAVICALVVLDLDGLTGLALVVVFVLVVADATLATTVGLGTFSAFGVGKLVHCQTPSTSAQAWASLAEPYKSVWFRSVLLGSSIRA